jgi:hypothetical protein
VWNWFDPKGEFDNDYIFAAVVSRGALQWKDDRFDVMVEAQNSSLVSLPDKASAPAPQGSLGLGAVYFAHNRREDDSHFFLKQGFVLFKNLGLARIIHERSAEGRTCMESPFVSHPCDEK